MKKFYISPINKVLKEILFLFLFFIFLFLSSSTLLAGDVQLISSTGRAVIIDGDIETAKKRALDDALYLASLQGGAKVDGFSSIDTQTNLRENLLIRPSSEIIDFSILEENQTKTHFSIKIKAALLHNMTELSCKENRKINLSYLKPLYYVKNNVPAWVNQLPNIISEHIFSNLSRMDDLNLLNRSSILIDPEKITNQIQTLDYDFMVEESSVRIKNGEFSIIPNIKIERANGRLHRFSREIMFSISMGIYQGPNFKFIDNLDYDFSLLIGNETGYSHIDSFYKVSKDKFLEYLEMSLSKFHFRILDQLKCMPLETKVSVIDQTLIAPIGTNQGLNSGTIGLVSNKNPGNSMENWSVLSVVDSNPDFSVLETLNPDLKLSDLSGKIIRFLD